MPEVRSTKCTRTTARYKAHSIEGAFDVRRTKRTNMGVRLISSYYCTSWFLNRSVYEHGWCCTYPLLLQQISGNARVHAARHGYNNLLGCREESYGCAVGLTRMGKGPGITAPGHPGERHYVVECESIE